MSAKLHFREHINNQLVLFPERIDKDIAPDDPVRLVNAVVDSLDMGRIYSLYHDRGASPYHPRMMLKVIIYSYMNNIYSCRKMENALKRDVHFIWLAGYDQPDHKTINNFRNRVKGEIDNVFTQLVLILAERGLISLDVEYIDGTKIESKANKYTFVWKKTVVKNRAKLQQKIRALLSQIDEAIAQENASQDESVEFTPAQLTEICEELRQSLSASPAPETREDKKARRQKEKGIRELGQMGDKLGEYDAQRCQGCPLRTRCHRKKRGNREIEVSHRLIAYKQRAREKLTSDKGLEHRSRRPIEPEAVFGQMKNNMHYKRFRHFGKDKATMDFAFFAIAFNIKKMAAMMAKPA